MPANPAKTWKMVISLDTGSRYCDVSGDSIQCGAPRIQVERPSQKNNPLDIMPEHAYILDAILRLREEMGGSDLATQLRAVLRLQEGARGRDLAAQLRAIVQLYEEMRGDDLVAQLRKAVADQPAPAPALLSDTQRNVGFYLDRAGVAPRDYQDAHQNWATVDIAVVNGIKAAASAFVSGFPQFSSASQQAAAEPVTRGGKADEVALQGRVARDGFVFWVKDDPHRVVFLPMDTTQRPFAFVGPRVDFEYASRTPSFEVVQGILQRLAGGTSSARTETMSPASGTSNATAAKTLTVAVTKARSEDPLYLGIQTTGSAVAIMDPTMEDTWVPVKTVVLKSTYRGGGNGFEFQMQSGASREYTFSSENKADPIVRSFIGDLIVHNNTTVGMLQDKITFNPGTDSLCLAAHRHDGQWQRVHVRLEAASSGTLRLSVWEDGTRLYEVSRLAEAKGFATGEVQYDIECRDQPRARMYAFDQRANAALERFLRARRSADDRMQVDDEKHEESPQPEHKTNPFARASWGLHVKRNKDAEGDVNLGLELTTASGKAAMQDRGEAAVQERGEDADYIPLKQIEWLEKAGDGANYVFHLGDGSARHYWLSLENIYDLFWFMERNYCFEIGKGLQDPEQRAEQEERDRKRQAQGPRKPPGFEDVLM